MPQISPNHYYRYPKPKPENIPNTRLQKSQKPRLQISQNQDFRYPNTKPTTEGIFQPTGTNPPSHIQTISYPDYLVSRLSRIQTISITANKSRAQTSFTSYLADTSDSSVTSDTSHILFNFPAISSHYISTLFINSSPPFVMD